MLVPAMTALALVWSAAQYAPATLQVLQATPAQDDGEAAPEKAPIVRAETPIKPPNVTIIEAETEVAEDTPEAESLSDADIVSEDTLSEADAEPVTITPPTRSGPTAIAASDWPTILASASAALSDARTAKGDFEQLNPDGSLMTGTFALSRPGRVRFDYDDPIPVLIVSDGTTVAMEDSELETVDRIPLGSTPLGFVLASNLDFDEQVDVLSILENEDQLGIRVADQSGEVEGTLTLIFDALSFDLLGWLAVDGNFQTTRIDLSDVETNTRLDPRLFRLDDPEDEEDER